MKNKSKKQVKKIDNSTEKLLLSDVIKSVCSHPWQYCIDAGGNKRFCYKCCKTVPKQTVL